MPKHLYRHANLLRTVFWLLQGRRTLRCKCIRCGSGRTAALTSSGDAPRSTRKTRSITKSSTPTAGACQVKHANSRCVPGQARQQQVRARSSTPTAGACQAKHANSRCVPGQAHQQQVHTRSSMPTAGAYQIKHVKNRGTLRNVLITRLSTPTASANQALFRLRSRLCQKLLCELSRLRSVP